MELPTERILTVATVIFGILGFVLGFFVREAPFWMSAVMGVSFAGITYVALCYTFGIRP